MANSAYFPPTVTITEGRHTGEYIKSEAEWMRSRDNVVMAGGSGVVIPGQVLGYILLGTPAVAAVPGNAGNGVVSAAALGPNAKPGAYTIEFTGATTFEVVDPAGKQLGDGLKAGPYTSPEVNFTFTAGSTAMGAGDSFAVTVPDVSAAGRVAPCVAGAVDGSQVAAAISYNYVDATFGDIAAAVSARDCEVYGQRLTFDASIAGNPAAVAAALRQLAARSIIAR